MKKSLNTCLACLLLLSAGITHAQLEIAAGLGLAYGTEAEAVGLQIRGDIDLTDQWGGSLNFVTFFSPNFGEEDLSGFADIKTIYREINFNAHYFAYSNDAITVYPLAGLNLTTAGIKSTINLPFVGSIGDTETKVGLNLGGGVRFMVADQISILGELKYVISDFDQLIIGAAGLYHF